MIKDKANLNPECPLCKKTTVSAGYLTAEYTCTDHYSIIYDVNGTFEYLKLWSYNLEMIWSRGRTYTFHKDGNVILRTTEKPPEFKSEEELENWILF